MIRPGTLEDASSLAPRLRQADARELTLAAGPDLTATLRASIANSAESWAAEQSGEVIALGGVTFIAGPQRLGVPWMVGSDELLQHPVKLVREGRRFVSLWGRQCDTLTNFVHAENRAHIEWLKRIGFTMGPVFPEWGHGKAPFIQFHRYNNV